MGIIDGNTDFSGSLENDKKIVDQDKTASELIQEMLSDKKLDGDDLAIVNKLQEKFSNETDLINKGVNQSLSKLKDGLKESTLNMLKKGYTISSESDFLVLGTMFKILGLSIKLPEYNTIQSGDRKDELFSITYKEGSDKLLLYRKQSYMKNVTINTDEYGSININTGEVSTDTNIKEFYTSFDDDLDNNNEFVFNKNLDSLSRGELIDEYNNIQIPEGLFADSKKYEGGLNEDVPYTDQNLKDFIEEKLLFKAQIERDNNVYELENLSNKRDSLLKLTDRSIDKNPDTTGIESLTGFTSLSQELKDTLIRSYNLLQRTIVTTESKEIVKDFINNLETAFNLYEGEINNINNAETLSNENNTDAENIVTTVEGLGTNNDIQTNGLSQNVTNVINNDPNLRIEGGKVYYNYNIAGKNYGNLFTIQNSENLGKSTVVSIDGEQPCDALGDAMSLNQWMISCVELRKKSIDTSENAVDATIAVTDSESSITDTVVEGLKSIQEWIKELFDDEDIASFIGNNGEKIGVEFNEDTGMFSIDTTFSDDISDYDQESLGDKKFKSKDDAKQYLEKNVIEAFKDKYDAKVLQEAFDDVNTKRNTTNVVDMLNIDESEGEKVYLKRADKSDGKINFFVQIGDEITEINTDNNDYTHTEVKDAIKKAKESYTIMIKEASKLENEALSILEGEVNTLIKTDIITTLQNHDVGNSNFKTIDLGTIDQKSDNIDIALRKYPNGSYTVMIDPDGLGNGKTEKIESKDFNDTNVKSIINKLIKEYRKEK